MKFDFPNRSLFPLLILVLIGPWAMAQCMDDCVWPGDLNANGVANQLDALAIGLAIGATGPARVDATTDWEAQTAMDWSGSLPVLGTNYKHCDANGDGVIDTNDQFAISINYDNTNPDFTGFLGNDLVGDDLFLVPEATEVSPGGSLFLTVHLGTAAIPIDSLYGIGFQLELNTQYVADVQFDLMDNWIGSVDEVFTYGKFNDQSDHAGVAVTRTDGRAVSGFGPIGRLEIIITDVILEIVMDSTACLPFPIQFKNTLGIDPQGNDLEIRARSDENTQVKHLSQISTATSDLLMEEPFHLFPNPNQGQFYIDWQGQAPEELFLWSTTGQLLWREEWAEENTSPYRAVDWSALGLRPGVYLLEIRSNQRQLHHKILLE